MRCKNGKLKHPVGNRRCKRRASHRSPGSVTGCKALVMKKMRAEIKKKVATCRRVVKKKNAAAKYAARFRPDPW